ncbi:MAG: hypothetical protein CL666_02895 [Balneola sp.]|nr:hypothetical protein [Balneola sp.]|tara:strand:- start:24664 stop:26427 length:1764 start_codon:yes stop_codon:yes gene_type:complete
MKKTAEQNGFDFDRKFIGLLIFASTCAILLIINVTLAISFASGLRGYVGGEGHWTKSQKESMIHLHRYILTENAQDYESFNSVLRVIMGDRRGREELKKDNYDYDVVFEGFRQGLNHPDDIPHMIRIFDWFHDFSPVKDAIEIWEEGDRKIDQLIEFGEHIHATIQQGDISYEQKIAWTKELNRLDHELTALELRFSESMDSMARLVNRIVKWATIILGLFIIGIGIWLTRRFYTSAKIWAETIKESENKFRNVLTNSQDILFKMNIKTKKYEYVSPALESMLGYDVEEFLEGGVDFILSNMHPEDKERIQKVVDEYQSINDREFLPTLEYRLQDAEGNWKWVSNTRNLVRDENGEPDAIVGTVRDISVRKEQDQQIKKSLEEKELLLQEIHHRVKNNLSIISSLLELQKDGMSEQVQQILSASQLRIKSIAKVHEKLYKSTNLSDTPLDVYVIELAEEIGRTYHSNKQTIEMQIDVLPLSVSINQAIPIGLIVNELINNAFKHAFHGKEEGTLIISIQEDGDHLSLEVKSNGNVLDKNFDPQNSDSLGMTLIQVLVRRIDGTLAINQDGEWSSFTIHFTFDSESDK